MTTAHLLLNIDRSKDTSVAYGYKPKHKYVSLSNESTSICLPIHHSSSCQKSELYVPYQVYLQLQSPVRVRKATQPKQKVSRLLVKVGAMTKQANITVSLDLIRDKLTCLNGTYTSGVRYLSFSLSDDSILLAEVKSGAGIITNAHSVISSTQDRLKLVESVNGAPSVADFYRHGVAGYDDVCQRIIDEVILPWHTPHHVLDSFGVTHEKGLLLYGRPGTGKTNIARALAAILGGKNKVQIINGPSLLSKYYGDSEANIRKPFEQAQADQAQYGDKSPLHILIFDEIDAIASTRRANSTSRADEKVVTQLLTCIDGLTSLRNLFVIGITNRRDMLDDAILRSGRLGLHIEVSYPSESQRVEILRYYLDRIERAQVSDDELNYIAQKTNGASGSDLSAMVKVAARRALKRHQTDPNTVITIDDLLAAIEN